MTFADDVATHLSTNYTAGLKSAGMVFDNIEDKTDAQWQQSGAVDVVMVIEQPHTLTPLGWGHVDQTEHATIKVWARVLNGAATMKERLDVVMDELEHVMHWTNHAIAGYTFHYCASRFDGSDKDRLVSAAKKEAYGVMTFLAFKNGRSA